MNFRVERVSRHFTLNFQNIGTEKNQNIQVEKRTEKQVIFKGKDIKVILDFSIAKLGFRIQWEISSKFWRKMISDLDLSTQQS